MNTIADIKLQNQEDFWAMLYLCIGKSAMEVCGRQGEKALRKGLRDMAEEKGQSLRDAYAAAGIKTNLETLYAGNVNCSGDPRVRMEVCRHQEDIRIWEVYTCPLATLWLDADQAFLGNLYCEENQHGLVRGFTGGKGQMNLTKKLTCHRTNGCRPDNYCRFSSYYRAANVEEQQRRESFTEAGCEPEPIPEAETANTQAFLNEKCIRTLYYLTNALEEEFGNEGLCAVSLGLKALVPATAEMLLHYEDATLSPDRSQFVKENLPLSLEADPAWEKYKMGSAYRLFQMNFTGPLKNVLGLQ